MDPRELTSRLKAEAARLGFELAGATPAVPPPGIEHLDDWLARGFAGQMRFFADRRAAYRHPRHLLPGVKSVLMLGTNYRTHEPARPAAGQGIVSRYAWGKDYHDLIRGRLKRLADFHRDLAPGAGVRGVVDTAPLLERDFARLAGLGWIGRNTMLVHERFGSWLFLAALLTTEPLDYDEPADDRCGSCTACLDACPTGALVEPYRLDARKCVSYLTIELRDPIPEELRLQLGDRLFGCDACQQACPHNQRTPSTAEESFQPGPGMNPVELAELFSLDETAFRARFRGTALWRCKREGILRNAAVLLGKQGHTPAESLLGLGSADAEPLVRGACQWALGQLESDPARALQKRRQLL